MINKLIFFVSSPRIVCLQMLPPLLSVPISMRSSTRLNSCRQSYHIRHVSESDWSQQHVWDVASWDRFHLFVFVTISLHWSARKTALSRLLSDHFFFNTTLSSFSWQYRCLIIAEVTDDSRSTGIWSYCIFSPSMNSHCLAQACATVT